MNYKRNKKEVFTISKLLEQIAFYIKEHRSWPEVIYLPPEEYVYINYLFNDVKIRITQILNIPLEITFETQDEKFHGF